MNDEEFEELRQRLQVETTQKQTLQLQYNELKRTLEEVDKSGEHSELFQLFGQVLLKKSKEDISKDIKDEMKVLKAISKDKFVYQADVIKTTGFSKVKVSKIISKLFRYGLIKIKPDGRTNKIKRI